MNVLWRWRASRAARSAGELWKDERGRIGLAARLLLLLIIVLLVVLAAMLLWGPLHDWLEELLWDYLEWEPGGVVGPDWDIV